MKVVMNSERFTPNTEQSAEKANFERQKRKLTGFYLSGGDENYIFKSNMPNYSDAAITPEAESAVLEMMANGVDFSEKENRLLRDIAGPEHSVVRGPEYSYRKGYDGVFNDMSDDKHQRRILTYMTGGAEAWNKWDQTSGNTVKEFLMRYPTPMDFEKVAEDFLYNKLNDGHNDSQKLQEYYEAMDSFQNNVYGKKYEYFKAMKDLHREAAEMGAPQENEAEPSRNRDIGRRSFEIFNREPLVKAIGARTLNKGVLTGEIGRQNEDSAYCNPNAGVFAVFDGAGGGGKDPARASQLAAGVTNAIVEEKVPKTQYDLAEILEKTNETIINDPEAGISTAVIGKIRDDGDHKTLAYASVGDSRIYLVRGEKPAIQITKDEGEGNRIYNAIGVEWGKVKQFGEVPLQDGDRLVFCSDGITGDYEKDFIPNGEFANIVRSAGTPDDAATALIRRATKKDDRTAVVVEV